MAEKEENTGEGAATSETITLKVRDQTGEEMFFKVREIERERENRKIVGDPSETVILILMDFSKIFFVWDFFR